MAQPHIFVFGSLPHIIIYQLDCSTSKKWHTLTNWCVGLNRYLIPYVVCSDGQKWCVTDRVGLGYASDYEHVSDSKNTCDYVYD